MVNIKVKIDLYLNYYKLCFKKEKFILQGKGDFIRSYIYIEDVCNGLEKLLKQVNLEIIIIFLQINFSQLNK